jgi:hypothetical protein
LLAQRNDIELTKKKEVYLFLSNNEACLLFTLQKMKRKQTNKIKIIKETKVSNNKRRNYKNYRDDQEQI